MQAKFNGWCKSGRHAVKPGEVIERFRGGWAHTGCINSATSGRFQRGWSASRNVPFALDAEAIEAARERAFENAEVAQGMALAEHISATRSYFGEAAAAAEEYAWDQKLGAY